MGETTIFDEQFDHSLKFRRHKLLHVWLRIYLGIGILLGGIILCAVCSVMLEEADSPMMDADKGRFYVGYIVLIMLSALYILKYILLILEVRTAIRWNWVVGAVTTLLLTVGLLMSSMPSFVLVELVSIPYWAQNGSVIN